MSPLTSLDLWPKNSDPKPSIPSFTLTPKTSILSYPSGFDKDWILEEIMAMLSLAFGFVFLINLPFSISPINLSLLRSHPSDVIIRRSTLMDLSMNWYRRYLFDLLNLSSFPIFSWFSDNFFSSLLSTWLISSKTPIIGFNNILESDFQHFWVSGTITIHSFFLPFLSLYFKVTVNHNNLSAKMPLQASNLHFKKTQIIMLLMKSMKW